MGELIDERMKILYTVEAFQYGAVMVSTGLRLIQIAVEWLPNSQQKITGKTNLSNLFGGNRQVAFAA